MTGEVRSEQWTVFAAVQIRVMRALCAAGGARTALELAQLSGQPQDRVQTMVDWLVARGFASKTSAWTLTHRGQAALAAGRGQARLTRTQMNALSELKRAGGARTVAELTGRRQGGTRRGSMTKTIRWLHQYLYIHPVSSWEPTIHAHVALADLDATLRRWTDR